MRLLNGNLEEMILIALLNKSPLPTLDLIKKINSGNIKFTKQGIYRVLRKLKKEEKVVMYRSIVSVNDLWLAKWNDVLEKSGHDVSLVGDLTNLTEKIYNRLLSARRRNTFLAVHGRTFLDKQMMNKRRSNDFRCSINSKVNANEYIAVLEDYVLEIKLGNRENRIIESIFKAADNVEDAKSSMYEIDKNAKSTLVIEKNKIKAVKWRKRISNEFF